jgi:hypothetical protein
VNSVIPVLRIVVPWGIMCAYIQGSGHTVVLCVTRASCSALVCRHTSIHTLMNARSLVRHVALPSAQRLILWSISQPSTRTSWSMLLHIWRNRNTRFHPLSRELSFVLLKYAFSYWHHMAVVMAWMNEWMSMEHRWNTDMGELKYLEKNLSHCHFIHHKLLLEETRVEHGPLCWDTAE